jgi:hypothetical protein
VAVVAFSYTAWAARFPGLVASVPEPTATAYFAEAEIYCDNSVCSLIPYEPTGAPPVLTRQIILNMIVAHLATLNSPINGQPASPLVGRISAATQGSVTVSVDMPQPNTAAWWNQSQYGAQAYAMMAGFRLAHYRASPGQFSRFRSAW